MDDRTGMPIVSSQGIELEASAMLMSGELRNQKDLEDDKIITGDNGGKKLWMVAGIAFLVVVAVVVPVVIVVADSGGGDGGSTSSSTGTSDTEGSVTGHPSTRPSFAPVIAGSSLPTVKLSAVPTVTLSAMPTGKSSLKPSKQPTVEPSIKPTMQPTIEPSSTPTMESSLQPTLSPQVPTGVPSVSLTPTCADEQVCALSGLFDATGGNFWTNNDGWLNYTDVCDWYGVSCSNDGVVTSIDLAENGLNGTLPGNGVWDRLSNIDTLYLEGNDIIGSLPSDLGELTSLTFLDLSYNNFENSIPSEFGSLSSLVFLDLSYNQLTGSLPTEIGNMSFLMILSIQSNDLEGRISIDGPICQLTNFQGGSLLTFNSDCSPFSVICDCCICF